MGDKHKYSELRDKIMRGAQLAVDRMIEKAKINDESLVFSKNGKVEIVKARSLK